MPTRTHIVATLGPSTDCTGVVTAMLQAGLDVARINFSHGTADEHRHRIAEFRAAARAAGMTAGVLADLPGPKLRALIPGPLILTIGQEIRLAASPGAVADIEPTEPEFLTHVRPGHRLLLDDGRLLLRAERHEGPVLVAVVEAGGTLLPKKGLNLPDTDLPTAALTQRDRVALVVAAAAGVDWLALSFVSRPEAADEVRQAARSVGLEAPVLAKIERPQAVERAAEIIAAFDGIMVARGDLGVEIPLEQVPAVQKRLIALARAAGKPVVTATEMLESMRTSPRPTRAETSDVANAIYDGTDAIMLSGETAVGDYPVEAVACMDRIAQAAEADLREDGWDVGVPRRHRRPGDAPDLHPGARSRRGRHRGADALWTNRSAGGPASAAGGGGSGSTVGGGAAPAHAGVGPRAGPPPAAPANRRGPAGDGSPGSPRPRGPQGGATGRGAGGTPHRGRGPFSDDPRGARGRRRMFAGSVRVVAKPQAAIRSLPCLTCRPYGDSSRRCSRNATASSRSTSTAPAGPRCRSASSMPWSIT